MFCLGLIITIAAGAQDKKKPEVSFNGYIKDLQTVIFSKSDGEWLTDNMLHNRLKMKWYPNDHLTFSVEMRNRLVWGEMLKMESLVPDSLLAFKYSESINDEKGFVDLSDFIFKEKSVLLHSTFDRLYLDYNKGKFNIRIGRQRINWAQTFVWNPNDLFNTYSFFDFDYEEKPGSDAVRAIWYPNFTSQLELAVKADYKDRITAALRYKFNKWSYDWQLIGGLLNDEDIMAGLGWSGSLFKGGLRGEFSYFRPQEYFADSTGMVVATLGYDYTFSNSLMLQFEALYQGDGREKGDFDLNEFYFLDLSAKHLSPAKWSFVGLASYPVTPLLNASLAAMYSPSLEFWYVGPTFSYSMSDNLELSFIAQTFQGNNSTDENGKGTYLFLRFKSSF